MKSYRHERMGELRGDMRKKHTLAGLAVQEAVRTITPVGTPASTGDPNYPITYALQRSIHFSADDYHSVVIGTNKPYGPYVHNGTYKQARGRGEWDEGEAHEYESMRLVGTPDHEEDGNDGMTPRPFLVLGLLNARPLLREIYGKPID